MSQQPANMEEGEAPPCVPVDEAEAPTCVPVEGATGEACGGVVLQTHSNANLLKINTWDKYSTVGAVKKYIQKSAPPPLTQQPPLPLLAGLVRMGKNPKNPHIFMAFDTPSDRDAARGVLTSIAYRQHKWEEVDVTERDLQLTHKGATRTDGDANSREKRPRTSEEGNGTSSSSSTLGICSWSDVPMDEQIERKERHCVGVMKKILQPNHHNGFVAYRTRFLGVVRSAQTEGYRNHVNFTFGKSQLSSSEANAEDEVVIGFNEGSIVDGKLRIESAEQPGNVTTHPLAMRVVAAFKRLCHAVRAAVAACNGGSPPFTCEVLDRVTGTGFWRRLQVRHNVHGEVMLSMELDPTSLPAGVEVAEVVFPLMISMLTSPTGELAAALREVMPTARVVSVQYYAHSGTTSPPFDAQRTVLFGVPALTEQLMGLSFDLNPAAFFQVNTAAFEDLLERVHRVAHLTKNTVLLDLCCGTGTIGLCLARHVKRVIGIELIDSAVHNARANATRNNIDNATFLSGRVETLLPNVINSLSNDDRSDIVAILDPPRAGVNATVVKWIRSTPSIRRVVYISCEQKALENDCPGFTKAPTNTYRGDAFAIESGFGVDLFPHTPHVEMIVVMDRSVATRKEVTTDGVEMGGEGCPCPGS